MKPLVHKHIIIRSEVLNPPVKEEQASKDVKDLIERIGMKLLMGPFAKYVTMPGNRGLTVASIIETSHIVLHSWDETDPAIVQLDVYTCGEFDPRTVFEWLEEKYNPVKIDYKYIDREHYIKQVDLPKPTTRRYKFSTQEIIQAMDNILAS